MKVVKVAAANPLKTVSPRDEMLIKKMLELLKKYGCEFCDRRFDTKFALSHHERWVLEIHPIDSLFILVARFGLFHLNPYFEQEPPEGASEEG